MFRYFFHRFKTHFELDRRQAKVHFVLLWLSMLVLCSPVFTYYTYPLFLPQEDYSVSIDTAWHDLDSSVMPDYVEPHAPIRKKMSQFSEQDWMGVGLPPYLAKRIMKYQAKGAVLKNKKDLAKVYGMNEDLLEKVSPFILEEVYVAKAFNLQKVKSKTKELLDINLVDSTSLVELPGIGPAFARRIIQYRTLLKGYVSKDQFKEVYGLSPFALEVLENNTYIKPQALASLKDCDYAKLNEHLYVSSKDARYIVNEVKKNGLCWDDLKLHLEQKAQEHIEALKLYYPCE